MFSNVFRVLDSLPHILWATSPTGETLFVNKMWREYTGTEFSLDCDQQLLWQQIVHPDDFSSITSLWSACVAAVEPLSTEFRMRGADGVYRWFLVRGNPVFDGKDILGWVGSSTNINVQKQDQEDAHFAIRIRDEFLSIASHELKTPLNSLQIQLHLVQRVLQGSPTLDWIRSKIKFINADVVRLTRLIDSMLDVSRITTGKFRLDVEEVDIVLLTKQILTRFEQEFIEAGCTVSMQTDVDRCVGHWDPMRVDQILSNILSNAVKYGKGNPVDVVVTTTSERVSVAVRDRGIGIAPADIQRIFQRFEQLVSAKHYGGFGLGLWIAHQMAAAHGGDIDVESVPDQGSTFTVILPITSAARR